MSAWTTPGIRVSASSSASISDRFATASLANVIRYIRLMAEIRPSIHDRPAEAALHQRLDAGAELLDAEQEVVERHHDAGDARDLGHLVEQPRHRRVGAAERLKRRRDALLDRAANEPRSGVGRGPGVLGALAAHPGHRLQIGALLD